jgi:hypothetical protein
MGLAAFLEPAMNSDDVYRRHAAEADRQARLARNALDRAAWLRVSQGWPACCRPSVQKPRIFNPSGLPLPDDAPATQPKVAELRNLSAWSEGQVWCSPERHGAMTGIMKAQIDWIPLSLFKPRWVWP